jgi:hypothetical protein
VASVVVMDVAIAPLIQNILKEKWLWQKNFLNLCIIIQTMELNKIHERVLEIQNQIQSVSQEQQTSMLNELLELASKIEQSLSEIKIEIDEK